MAGSDEERLRAFAAWFEKRGGWVRGPTLSFAIDAVLSGYEPARAFELALAFVYDRPVKRVVRSPT